MWIFIVCLKTSREKEERIRRKEERKKREAQKVEQLGTLLARYSIAAANQFWENEDFLSVEIQTRILKLRVLGYSTIQ